MQKKLPKSSELMWLLGTITVALGVCICKKANLGVSMIAAPAFIVYEAVSKIWSGFSVGMIEYLIQGVLLVILCIATQRHSWKYLLAFVVAILYGYTLDFWLWLFGNEPYNEIYIRWIMFFVGDVVVAFGVACYFRTYLPLQVYELFVAEMADRYKKNVNRTKYVFDAACLAVSITLAFTLFGDVKSFDWSKIFSTNFHSIGVGTIITTVINAPIISVFGKLLDRFFSFDALIPKFEKIIGRKKQKNEPLEKTHKEL